MWSQKGKVSGRSCKPYLAKHIEKVPLERLILALFQRGLAAAPEAGCINYGCTQRLAHNKRSGIGDKPKTKARDPEHVQKTEANFSVVWKCSSCEEYSKSLKIVLALAWTAKLPGGTAPSPAPAFAPFRPLVSTLIKEAIKIFSGIFSIILIKLPIKTVWLKCSGYLLMKCVVISYSYSLETIKWENTCEWAAGFQSWYIFVLFCLFTKEEREREKKGIIKSYSDFIDLPPAVFLCWRRSVGSWLWLAALPLPFFFLLQWDLVAKVNAKAQLLGRDDGCTEPPFTLFALVWSQFSWSAAVINLCRTRAPSLQQSKLSSFITCLAWFQKHHIRLSL